MKKLLATTAIVLAFAAPAFASPLVSNDSHDTTYSQGQSQGQLQGQLQGQKAYGGSAEAGAFQSQSTDNNGNEYTSDDDDKTEVYAVSYTDAAPNTVSASIGDGVVVTTWGVKVLGPVFGMTDQHVHYLPAALSDAAKLGYLATTNDGSIEGEQVQFAHIAAICAHDEKLAEQLNFGCK